MAIRISNKTLLPYQLRHGRPMVLPEMPLAHEHCKGQGIELGAAAHNPFGLPGALNVVPFSDDVDSPDYADFMIYVQEQMEMCGHFAEVDIVAEADAIPMDDDSLDYVISSHVVEHIPDLIKAFLEWTRIVRPNGIIFMVFPKRNATEYDATRPLTAMSEFIENFVLNRTVHTHEGRYRGHYHVFSLGSMVELIEWCNMRLNMNWELVAVEETDSKVGNGHTIVARVLK